VLQGDAYHGRNLRIAEEHQAFKQSAGAIDGQKVQLISLSGMREDALASSQASRRCQAHRRHLQRSDAETGYFEPAQQRIAAAT
jgi:hypothetical protein